jgi:hypothetical protein
VIVSEPSKRRGGGVVRIEATVRWEDSDRPELPLFVDAEERHADAMVADPNVFAAACLLPAWRSGEKRLRVEGALCPVLCERMKTPTGMLKAWYPNDFGPRPEIEAAGGHRVAAPADGRAVSLLSCGIDSLATLRWNRLHVARGHPDAIEACVYFEFDERKEASLALLLEATGPRSSVVAAVTADAAVDAIPVRTNVWWLANDGWFYTKKWHGAFLASLVSAFSGRFRKGYVASSHSPAVVQPYGSHPLLDPYFSSAHFQVEHDLFSMDRADKVALVADWPVGAANIRVCQNDSTGRPNCGTCEKCIRTLVQLAGIGKLAAAAASFPDARLTPDLIATIDQYDMIRGHPYFIGWYGAEIPKLRTQGRHDLADALSAVVESASVRPAAH